MWQQGPTSPPPRHNKFPRTPWFDLEPAAQWRVWGSNSPPLMVESTPVGAEGPSGMPIFPHHLPFRGARRCARRPAGAGSEPSQSAAEHGVLLQSRVVSLTRKARARRARATSGSQMVNAIEGGSRCRVVPQPHKIETLAREDFPMACQFFAKIREPKIGVKGGLHKQVALGFHRRGRGGRLSCGATGG